MLKKILILFLLTFFTIPIMQLSKVFALTNTTVDLNYRWEYYNTYSTYACVRLSDTDIVDYTTIINLTIGDYGFNVSDIGGQDSYILIEDSGTNTLFEMTLEDFMGGDLEGEVVIDLVNNWIHTDKQNFVVEDLITASTITIYVFQSFEYSNPPSSFLGNWVALSNLEMVTLATVTRFYKLGALYEIQYTFNENPEPPTVSPTYTGYFFTGWKTLQSIYYDFTSPILPEYLNSEGEFLLYATFTSLTEIDEPDFEQITNLPEPLETFLTTIGLNTNGGYFAIFFLLNFIVIFISLMKKFNPIVPVVISIILVGLFIYFGLLTVASIVILVLLYIFIVMISTKRTQGSEQNE